MKLGAQLDPISPISLTGIVDVYNTPAGRVARKWPVKAKQPRTPTQEAHWKRIREMNQWFHSLPGWYVSNAKLLNTPPAYTWYDMLMRSYWYIPIRYNKTVYDSGPHWFSAWWWDDQVPPNKIYGIVLAEGKYSPMEVSRFLYLPNSTGHVIPLQWENIGLKCVKGKKSKTIYAWDETPYSTRAGINYKDLEWFITIAKGEPEPVQIQRYYRQFTSTGTRYHPSGSPYLLQTYVFHALY